MKSNMFRKLDRYFEHSDERGSFEGLVNVGTWKEINLVTSGRDMIRGGHYHESTEELFIILEGKIRVSLESMEEGSNRGEFLEFFVEGGDVFIIEPKVCHTFHVLTDSKWINVLSRPLLPENPDLHKVE